MEERTTGRRDCQRAGGEAPFELGAPRSWSSQAVRQRLPSRSRPRHVRTNSALAWSTFDAAWAIAEAVRGEESGVEAPTTDGRRDRARDQKKAAKGRASSPA